MRIRGFAPPRPPAIEAGDLAELATRLADADRKGVVSPEMARVAEREHLSPESVRDEVAAGRMIVPCQRAGHLAVSTGIVPTNPLFATCGTTA